MQTIPKSIDNKFVKPLLFKVQQLQQTQFYKSFTVYHLYLVIDVHCIGFHFYNKKYFNLYT